jgi:hypothetical protein
MSESHAFLTDEFLQGEGWNEVAHPGLDFHTLDWFSLD